MELECLEGRVFGARYYTVRPIMRDWARLGWTEIEEWCADTFGPTPTDGIWTPGSRWYANNGKFWFRNEADRTMFILKWQK